MRIQSDAFLGVFVGFSGGYEIVTRGLSRFCSLVHIKYVLNLRC